MRSTKQKELILDIVNHSYSHPTAAEIYQKCREYISNISLGTVYRNLNLLVLDGLIKRIKMPDNVDRYDRVDNHHIHFICVRCNKILDLENIDGGYKMINEHKVLDYEVNFKGICKNCLEKEYEDNE